MPSCVDRHAIKGMSSQAKSAFTILKDWETAEFMVVPKLCEFLEEQPIQFVTFSCLGTKKGKEELKLSLEETFFFRYQRNVIAREIIDLMVSSGIETEITVILPDTEPIRTWGWGLSQEELSGYCHVMIEDNLAKLPQGWKVVLWSEIEAKVGGFTYEDSLMWAKKSAHPLVVKEEALHLLGFPNILTKGKAEDVALRQVAAYAFEGYVLEQCLPNAILLQSEFPVKRKDGMYQPLRTKKLPVVHPFPLP
ncbi:MAG: hypothetical protein AAB394_00130 [Patescibacteria group bacterium]